MFRNLALFFVFFLISTHSLAENTTDTLTLDTGDRVRVSIGIVEASYSLGNANQLSVSQEALSPDATVQDLSLTLPSLITTGQNVGIIEGTVVAGDNAWNFILKTIVNEGNGKIISDTFGVVDDQKMLEFNATSKEPYQTLKVIGNTEQLVVEFFDIGVTAKITPTIKKGEEGSTTVQVDLEFEISEVLREKEEDNDSIITVPVRSVRRIKTTITASPSEYVVLGGLDQEKKITIERGIPFFRNIPLLGSLFTSKEKTVAKTKVYIITNVSPLIPKDKTDYEEFREKTRDEMNPTKTEKLQ